MVALVPEAPQALPMLLLAIVTKFLSGLLHKTILTPLRPMVPDEPPTLHGALVNPALIHMHALQFPQHLLFLPQAHDLIHIHALPAQ